MFELAVRVLKLELCFLSFWQLKLSLFKYNSSFSPQTKVEIMDNLVSLKTPIVEAYNQSLTTFPLKLLKYNTIVFIKTYYSI